LERFSLRSPQTPTMNDVLNDLNHVDNGSRRCSTPGNSNNPSDFNKWRTEPIDICTDCFFLLQQIRKKSRQHHNHLIVLIVHHHVQHQIIIFQPHHQLHH
jgi:hypothetical protein